MKQNSIILRMRRKIWEKFGGIMLLGKKATNLVDLRERLVLHSAISCQISYDTVFIISTFLREDGSKIRISETLNFCQPLTVVILAYDIHIILILLKINKFRYISIYLFIIMNYIIVMLYILSIFFSFSDKEIKFFVWNKNDK